MISNNHSYGLDYIEAIAFNFALVDTPPALPTLTEIVHDETNHLGNLPLPAIDSLCEQLLPPDRMRLACTCKILFVEICMSGNARWKDVGGSLAAFQNLCRWIRDIKNNRVHAEVIKQIYLAWPANCLQMISCPPEVILVRLIRQDPSFLRGLLITSSNLSLYSLVWPILHSYGLPGKSLDTFCKLVSDTFLDGQLSTDLANINGLLKRLKKDYCHYNFNENLPAPLIDQLNALNRPWRFGPWHEI
jgi:hypothetical protein